MAMLSRESLKEMIKEQLTQILEAEKQSKFEDWCKKKGFQSAGQECINKAAKEGGKPSSQAGATVFASKEKELKFPEQEAEKAKKQKEEEQKQKEKKEKTKSKPV
jgi:hypothetical protein